MDRHAKAPGEARIGLAGVLSVSIAIQALASFSVFALPTVAPTAAAGLGIEPRWIGFQTSLIYLIATLVSLAAGPVLNRHGPARTSQFALLAVGLGLAVMVLGTLPAVLLASTMIGFGYALTNPSASEILSRTAMGGYRNLVFSAKQTAVPLGAVVASATLPMLASALGWRIALLIPAAVVLFSAAFLQRLRPAWDLGPRRRLLRDRHPLAGVGTVVRSPSLRILAVTGFSYSTVQLAVGSYAVVMLVSEFGWSLLEAGVGAAVLQASGIVGRLVWGVLADRLANSFLVLAIIGLLTTLFTGLLAVAASFPSAALVAILAGLGATAVGWNGVLLSDVTRRVPAEEAGQVTAAVLMFTFAGVIVGPLVLAGLLSLTGSYRDAFAVVGVAPLVAAALLFRRISA